MDICFVGLGGAAGAMLRYGVSLLPWEGDFPLLTLITNVLGALLIGLIAGLAQRRGLPPGALLFWKTGVCGGFTTFSTFSLEAYTLFQRGRWGAAGAYLLLSAGLCLGGVALGLWLAGAWD
jgi:fluoride exporter